MKPIYFCILTFLLSFSTIVHAQSPCDAVSVEVIAPQWQTGQYSYFGVRVSISQPYYQDITVSGYIWDNPNHDYNEDHPYTLTISAGSLSAETPVDFYQTGPAAEGAANIMSVSPCPVYETTATYAGVTVTYEMANHILRFNSAGDFNTVVNQLETDYDTYNDNYDAQYPSLTPDQMDDMDATNNFDEFAPYKNFESLFSGFVSKRSQIESTENTWLANSFTGTDPDDIDLTFDESLNTIFNSDYSFKVGNDVYQLTANGLYINGVLTSAKALYRSVTPSFASYHESNSYESNSYGSNSEVVWPDCQTNKKSKGFADFGSDRYKLKVSITSLSIRSGARGKVVHYKSKNGSWKRSRAKMAVACGGNVYNVNCGLMFSFADRNPSPSGWKKRRQLKVARHDTTIIWKTKSNELEATFDTEVGNAGVLYLTW